VSRNRQTATRTIWFPSCDMAFMVFPKYLRMVTVDTAPDRVGIE
jgi:hypothetical protein